MLLSFIGIFMTVAVVYIARGIDAGMMAAKAFFSSYNHYDPGITHRLYVVVKGWNNNNDFSSLELLIESQGSEAIHLPDDGYDWGAYIRIASKLPEDEVCFLNSHSKIRAHNWLSILSNALKKPNVGAAGATGSWSTWAFSRPLLTSNPQISLLYPFRIANEVYRNSKYKYFYTPFPNIHLRSNAFIVQLETFREYCNSISIPSTKSDSHLLESSTKSLSNFVQSRHLSLLVCGANTVSYEPHEWIESNTFRTPFQENLLVEDNQTQFYMNASTLKRRQLEYKSWQKVLS